MITNQTAKKFIIYTFYCFSTFFTISHQSMTLVFIIIVNYIKYQVKSLQSVKCDRWRLSHTHILDDDDDVSTNLSLQLTLRIDGWSPRAAGSPMSHHSVVTSPAHLLPDFIRLTALSLTAKCQGHSQKCGSKGCQPQPLEDGSSSETNVIWPQHWIRRSTNH